MPDLHAAIRKRLETYPTAMPVADLAMANRVNTWLASAVAAFMAVLARHQPDQRGNCAECREGGSGYEAEPVQAPCPTVRDIAEKLGIET